MKYCGALLTLLVVVAAVCADLDEHPCDADRDCERDECCVLGFTGTRKVGHRSEPHRTCPIGCPHPCRDIGDDLGDVCGGVYFCNFCRKGLECVTVSNSDKQNTVRDSNSCGHPANGTCEWPSRGGGGGGQGFDRDRPVL